MENMERLNIPIYRASELSTEGSYITGYLFSSYCKAQGTEETYITVRGDGNMLKHKIDISTLEISFDNGENWERTEWCKNMLNIARNAMDTFRK